MLVAMLPYLVMFLHDVVLLEEFWKLFFSQSPQKPNLLSKIHERLIDSDSLP